MKDQDLYPILDRVACICSRFNVTIKYVPQIEAWVVKELYWHYSSIHEMLFGNDSMFTFSESDISYFRSQRDLGLIPSFINLMASLKSNTIEELSIKLDLYENGNY